jgi:ABC-2 type transport system ATP-binding protein
MTDAIAIDVRDLTKSFKQNQVLKGVSFQVPNGTIFALLGPNGAGKTTIINILTTLLKADGGTAKVSGYDVKSAPDKVRTVISLTGQFAAIDDVLTGRENLVLIAELRHEPDPNGTADRLLRQFDLSDASSRPAQSYSGGMRRRLDIAMSLIGNPKVIFLDEPTTGLDPTSRNVMWDQVRSLAAAGKTVFLTTQYLEEADQLADHIAVLDHGRIVALGTPESLKRLLPHGQVELTFKNQRSLVAAQKALNAYQTLVPPDSDSLLVTTDGSVAQLSKLLEHIQSARLEIAEFSQKTPTLDDAFLKIINQPKEN